MIYLLVCSFVHVNSYVIIVKRCKTVYYLSATSNKLTSAGFTFTIVVGAEKQSNYIIMRMVCY